MTDMMAAHTWRTNAHMLADLFRIMPPPQGEWIDLTYGEEGGWWREPNTPPDGLVRCIGPDTVAPDGVETVRIDFRATAHGSNRFALTCFDPPYVLKGGQGKFDAMNQRYGVGGSARSDGLPVHRRPLLHPKHVQMMTGDGKTVSGIVALEEAATIPMPKGWEIEIKDDFLHGVSATVYETCGPVRLGHHLSFNGEGWRVDDDPMPLRDPVSLREAVASVVRLRKPTSRERLENLICDGLTEAARITRPGGWILAKSGRGVDGGKLFPTNHVMTRHADLLGLLLVQELVFLTVPRSQAHRGPQKTPRSNYSILHVFEVAS